MTRFTVCLEPRGSIFIGGYAASEGTADAVTAGDGRGALVPGSAVKGALREAAERLVRAAGHGEAELAALFGVGGGQGREGVLRVGTLRATLAGDTLPALAVRHHVSLERATRSAAPGLLFENRVTPTHRGLTFEGEILATRPLTTAESELLFVAAEVTDQVGGGRGRGLGWVSLMLKEDGASTESAEGPEAPPGPVSRVLVFEAREPMQLAGVKDSGNFTPTKAVLDGSTLRGAVAAHLADQEPSPLFSAIAGPCPVVFGDAHPESAGALPAPLSLHEPKGGGTPVDEALLLAAEARSGRFYPRPQDVRRARGSWWRGPNGWQKARVVRRTVTRTARDTASGRAADGLLYTLEVIDPFVAPGEPLRLFAPVTGDGAAVAAVEKAARAGLVVGGGRNRGFGRLEWTATEEPPDLGSVADRHAAWVAALAALGVADASATGVILALGPVALDAGRLDFELGNLGLELLGGVTRRQVHGGWLRRLHLPRTVGSHFVPGSVWIVATRDGGSACPALEGLESDGLGPGRPDGWGRLVACHPIHLDTAIQKTKEVTA
jgi:hypothetical protein